MSKKSSKDNVFNISEKIRPSYKTGDENQEIEDKEHLDFTKVFKNYSENFIYNKAYDKRGHSIGLHARATPWIMSEIMTMIESKRTPYKNVSGFLRDALFHRLMFWARELKFDHGVNIHKRMISEWIGIQEEMELDFIDSIDRFRKIITRLSNDGDKKGQEEFINNMVNRIDVLGDEGYKTKYIKAVKGILLGIGIDPKKYIEEE